MAVRNLAIVAGHFAYSFPATVLAEVKRCLKPNQNLTRLALAKPTLDCDRFQQIAKGASPLGVIGVSVRTESSVVAASREAGVPIVLIDERADHVSMVATDNFQGGFLAGQHLVQKGRRNIAVVCGPSSSYNAGERLRGFRAALAKADLSLPDTHVIEVAYYSYDEGRAAMTTWLERRQRLDAIFAAAGDDCARGIMRAAREAGVNVPADIALVGYDDLEGSALMTPPLTTVRQPIQEMARAAYELASDAEKDLVNHPQKAMFVPDLIVRGST